LNITITNEEDDMSTRQNNNALFVTLLAGAVLWICSAYAGQHAVSKPKTCAADGESSVIKTKIDKKCDRKEKAKVNKAWEAKADSDKDGVVEAREAHAYFRAKSVVDRPWEEKADANNDGKVEWKELRVYHKTQMDTDGNGAITTEERIAYWTKVKSVVNTRVEKKYDKDGDGYLSWEEGKELLKDKAEIIKTKGKALVNTDLEAEFDKNSDGVIDGKEAPALLEAIK
jgi:Ca2+-binding EF-hand superfamily protein